MSLLKHRNAPLVALAGLVVAALFAGQAYQRASAKAQGPDGPAPATAPPPISAHIPPGTTLVIGDPTTQRVLEHTGWDKDLPFKVQWAEISGGPAVTEAFHARALDVGSAADIPPIHAIWVGIPVKIVAFRQRQDPLQHPIYVLGVSPRAKIDSLADLRGKKIAFSPGQAQGAVVLRTLEQVGLSQKDVTLVELPATSDVYTTALAAGLVDAAPLGAGLNSQRYLDQYGKDGAKLLSHGAFRDDAGVLYVRAETLQDPAKAAAIREYVKVWARAAEWVQTHRAEWVDAYYVKQQGVDPQDAKIILTSSGEYDIPASWTGVIARQQATIDFMAKQTAQKPFDAHALFDRRFEPIAADAIAQYKARDSVVAAR